jgi:hypothetical protein
MNAFKRIMTAIGMVSMLAASAGAQPVQPLAPAKTAPQTPIPPAALPPLPPDPELTTPDTDTTKRVQGYAGDQALGGADCRTQCDKAYYLCLAVDDSGQCPTTWTQCLTACPSHSSNF